MNEDDNIIKVKISEEKLKWFKKETNEPVIKNLTKISIEEFEKRKEEKENGRNDQN